MWNVIRSHRTSMYAYAVLLIIPLVVMGWTIGRYGPGGDDWIMVSHFQQGNFANFDVRRPLHVYSHALIWLLAGGKIPTIEALAFLLEGISAVMFFEVTRRTLKHWLGTGEVFPAFLVSLVYVLYPAWAARYGILWVHDSTMRILTLAVALTWIISCETDRPGWVVIALVLALITLFHKENPVLVFFLFPLIPLYFDKSVLRKPWRNAILLWYVVMGLYVVWRTTMPKGANGPTGDSLLAQSYRSSLLAWLLDSVNKMAVTPFGIAFGDDLPAMMQLGRTWLLPVAAIASGLIVAIGWWISRSDSAGEEPGLSVRKWLYITSFGIAVMFAGLILFYFAYGNPIVDGGILTRYNTIAMLGTSLTLGMIVLLPWLAQRMISGSKVGSGRGARSLMGLSKSAGPLVTGVLATLLLLGSVIRNYRIGQDYIDAWTIQRSYWNQIAELGLTFRPGTLIIFDGFPRNINGAPLAGYFLGYGFAMQAIFADMPTDLPSNITTLDQMHVKFEVSGDRLTLLDDRVEHASFDVRNVVVLNYDLATGLVKLEPHLPYSWAAAPPYIYTGENPSQTPTGLDPHAAELLGPPVEPGGCQTRVPVATSDTAPSDGVVEVAQYPQNEVLDRRPVTQGTPLDFNFVAPCGVWLRAYFVTDDGAGGSSWARLLSQYGPDAEFGTGSAADTVSYATAFSQAEPAQPLH